MSEKKLCPSCGNNKVETRMAYGQSYWVTKCYNGECPSLPEMTGETEGESERRWNDMALSLEAQNRELEAENLRLEKSMKIEIDARRKRDFQFFDEQEKVRKFEGKWQSEAVRREAAEFKLTAERQRVKELEKENNRLSQPTFLPQGDWRICGRCGVKIDKIEMEHELSLLRTEKEAAQRACAEMRIALQTAEQHIEVPLLREQKRVIELIENAYSSDCGRGYVSRDVAEKVVSDIEAALSRIPYGEASKTYTEHATDFLKQALTLLREEAQK